MRFSGILCFCILVISVSTSWANYHAIVVDAGSTGSRAFLYKLVVHNDTESVVSTSGLKVKPGLSTFSGSPAAAGDYLMPLFLDLARYVPPEVQKSTPVFIQGTAGIRLLSEADQEGIWDSVYVSLSTNPSFPFFLSRSQLGTMSGLMEAYYAALSSNYIVGNIETSLVPRDGAAMVGALDMGGSSTQLIFHVGTDPTEALHHTHFWSHSWLTYGAEATREKIWIHLANLANAFEEGRDSISNPCLWSSYREVHSLGQFIGVSDLEECVKLIETVLWTTEERDQCVSGASCAIDGVLHPPLSGHFYAMSVYFYAFDCIREFLGSNSIQNWPTPTIQELREATVQFCSLNWFDVAKGNTGLHRYTPSNQLPYRCFEALYILTLLRDGFGFSETSRNITFALDLDGYEVDWTLGFALSVAFPDSKLDPDDDQDIPSSSRQEL